MNLRSRRRSLSTVTPDGCSLVVRRAIACSWLVCLAIAALCVPIRAAAQFRGSASATGQFESNSNVFSLESGATRTGPNGTGRSDTDYSYGAQVEGKYLLGRQEIYATASTTDFHYQHFTQLNHKDYKVDAGLRWRLLEFLDGRVDVTRTRTMVPFLDLSGEVLDLSVATEQRETFDIGLKLPSDWRVEGSASTSKISQPIPQEPNFESTQTSGSTSLQYVGIGGLATGFTAGYLSGRYSGSNSALNASYDQVTAGYMARYKLTRTTVEGQVGYTSRRSGTGLDNNSGLTASLDFKEQVTPRTNVTVTIGRAINSYLPSLGSEIDTNAGVGVGWQATYKLTVTVGYTFIYRDYPPQPGYAPGANRVDYQHQATANISYQARRWLLIRPYASVLTRESNVSSGNSDSTIFGIAVTATVGDGGK